MQHFYDGQIRRYITQLMRIMSNFPVKDGKGKITTVPVMYGDLTRQVANLIRDNSENKLPSVPRMSVYITGLDQDRERTQDPSFVNKINIKEREFDENANEYLNTQGKNYTVERLMPTPFTLKANVDVWTSNTDQKLQIIEQIGVWFNPTLELQTTDNFIDWTSITTLELENINWSNRTVPVGIESEVDIATLSFIIPIYISPPAKVKRLGVIQNIITSLFDETTGDIESGITQPQVNAYNDGITAGVTETASGRKAVTEISSQMANVNYLNYAIYVEGTTAKIIHKGSLGTINWNDIFETQPGKFTADISRIYLNNKDSSATPTGTISLNPLNETVLNISWDSDSFPQDTIIGGRTSVDFIIDPSTFNPTTIKAAGVRLLLLGDIGNTDAVEGAVAWKNNDNTNFVASANDIIEWDGAKWIIVFDASESTTITYTTNLNTSIQYRYADGSWLLSIDGEYPVGTWRLSLEV
jgi:hypothetical protein